MNKKIFIYGIVFVVLISFVYAYTLNTFSDGTTKGNITVTSPKGTNKYLEIPYWAVITKAEINLTGNAGVVFVDKELEWSNSSLSLIHI